MPKRCSLIPTGCCFSLLNRPVPFRPLTAMRLSGFDAQLMATSRVPRKRQNQLTDAGEAAPPIRGGAGRG
ncbi:hypothetical protein E2C01_096204 [Portunus trituberculatus]|uniref:Uncharacterized protein n=1 Tax=Portunus trituberculatus TaxID=210409 RepID=A0A5B7JV08_PORTR|nr:hypothetical protein [Portunus trituberculatus]